jgi:UDP-glucose 6-dehydrogenase
MNIGVIGCGYVGLVLAAGFAEPGHNDAESDAARLELLQKGQSGLHERHPSELLRKHPGARLQFRQSIEETVQQAKVVFICGGTPSLRSGETDLLDAGIGFGGPCFPKDLHAFRALSRPEGYRFDLLSEVIRINRGQRFRFLEKVRMALSPLSGKRIAVLGLSFKGRADDIGQSPAVEIVRHLVHGGAKITAFDPGAMSRARKEFSETAVSFAADSYAAMRDADALLILTEWPEFAALELQCVRNLLRTPIVLDRRNLCSPCQTKVVGLNYISVGRPFALASSSAAESLPLPSSTDNDFWTQDKGSSLGSATQ